MTSYWLIESEEAKVKWNELVAVAEQKRTRLKDWIAEIGGSGTYLGDSDGRVAGIKFEEHPGKVWGHNKGNFGYYYPKRNTKIGKQLYAEMIKHRGGLGREDVGKAFLGHWRIFSGGRLCSCGWETTNKGIILMATEGTGEREGKEQWKPTEGLRKLKDSAYWAIKETEKQTN